LESRCTVGHDNGADEGIGIGSPSRGSGDNVADIIAVNPARSLGLVGSGRDVGDEGVCPSLGVAESTSSDELLRHIRIPVGMEVVRVAIKRDLDVITTDLIGLIVKGLSDITDKVDEELERLGRVLSAQPAISDTRSVVGKSRDRASGAATVTAVIDIAGGCWVVLGIDEVERRRPGPGSCSTIVISPGSNISQVRRRGVTENALGPILFPRIYQSLNFGQRGSQREAGDWSILTTMPSRQSDNAARHRPLWRGQGRPIRARPVERPASRREIWGETWL
jgi:hypothetical protein